MKRPGRPNSFPSLWTELGHWCKLYHNYKVTAEVLHSMRGISSVLSIYNVVASIHFVRIFRRLGYQTNS